MGSIYMVVSIVAASSTMHCDNHSFESSFDTHLVILEFLSVSLWAGFPMRRSEW